MKFFVEVRTDLGHSTVIKREPAESWQSAVTLAQTMAVQMFREDPMASRVFVNGSYAYANMNDLGDPVSIRPLVAELEEIQVHAQ